MSKQTGQEVARYDKHEEAHGSDMWRILQATVWNRSRRSIETLGPVQQRRKIKTTDRFHEKVVQVGTMRKENVGDMDDKFRTHGIAEVVRAGFLLDQCGQP